jgi:hypothetical protein
MKNILIIIFLFFVVGFTIIVNIKIKQGKLNLVDTYSYKTVFKRSILHFFIVLIISLLIYLFSNSIEAAISLGVLLLAGVVAGCLYGLLWESQTKRRGGKKVD